MDTPRAATEAVGVAYADDKAPAPRPAHTRILVEHGAAGATVSYGYSTAFFVFFLICAALALACVSAVRLLGARGNLADVGRLVSWLPAIPPVDDLVQAAPLTWLFWSSLIGGVLSLGWIFHVHKVEITGDTVYVHRGLRPFARRYPRPPYDRVVGLEHSVHIGRVGKIDLINPTASPQLAKDEALWVASEMRRAMRRTAPETPA